MANKPTWVDGGDHVILWSDGKGLYQTSAGYWHVDEVWCDSYGPFATHEEAVESLNRYCRYLDTGEV
jgi:hypothetical protein